ncbi:MAG: hypothetical protein H6983_12950 [Ectothiorhodospiraceae bacterium]|nr:hypothetical protein [Ectothiorhodospiraceae bacterium]
MTDEALVDGKAALEAEHLVRAAHDALTDDMVSRMAETAAQGMDLLDQVNRAGLARAIPALTALVQNGDLDRIVALARLWSSAEDALTDDMINRLSESLGEGLSLLDRVNRSGVAKALPAITQMVESGDLERLAALARLYASAEDALTDDMIARVAEALGEGMSLLDRFSRCGAGRLVETLAQLEASGSLDRLCSSIPRLAERMDAMLGAFDAAGATAAAAPKSSGGVFAAVSMLSDADNQDALRYLISIGKELRARSGV